MSQLWDRKPVATSPLSVVVLGSQVTAASLRETLQGLHETLQLLKQAVEVLVPIAPDQEMELKEALSACSHARFVTDLAVREGVGTALRLGIAAAQHPLLWTLPIGYDASQLGVFLKEIDQVDIVAGVREAKVKGWKRRQFFSKAYQIFGLWMQDPTCPMKLYRKEIFDRLPVQSHGAFAQIEILAKATFQSRLITEAAITGPVDEDEQVSRDFWKVLNSPDFGKAPERVVAEPVKPIITSQAPEARV